MSICSFCDANIQNNYIVRNFSFVYYAPLLEENKILTEFKGALAEQYVMQELTTIGCDYIGYWTNERSTSEVDFVIQKEGEIIPIEVKSGENLHAKSFTLFCEKYKPSKAIKTSPLPYHDNGKVVNVPLYGIAYI